MKQRLFKETCSEQTIEDIRIWFAQSCDLLLQLSNEPTLSLIGGKFAFLQRFRGNKVKKTLRNFQFILNSLTPLSEATVTSEMKYTTQ